MHTHTVTQKHTALNIQPLTIRAPRQGRGLSLRPPAETLRWSHYLGRRDEGEGESERDAEWMDVPADLMLKHQTQASLRNSGKSFPLHACAHKHTHGRADSGEWTHLTNTHTFLSAWPKFLSSHWLLYLRGAAWNTHPCFGGQNNISVCPGAHSLVLIRASVCVWVCVSVWVRISLQSIVTPADAH